MRNGYTSKYARPVQIDYVTAEKAAKRRTGLICGNTRASLGHNGAVEIRLHGHIIATILSDGAVLLGYCGGWRSATTKDRLNRVLRPTGAYVYQRDFGWYIRDADGKAHGFDPGYWITPDGKVRNCVSSGVNNADQYPTY